MFAKNTQGKVDQIISQLKNLFPRIIPKISLRENGIPEFEFDYSQKSFNLAPLLEDLYEAVEKHAKANKKCAVVVFDEFQEILGINSDHIERSMRGIIQSHKNTAYVFMGSRRHLMHKIFNDPERPFYKSGRMFPLH